MVEEKKIRQELKELAEQEHIMWMQKSRIEWILQGDRNTKFYHTMTTKRRIKNGIQGIWNEQKAWVKDQKGISEAFY